MATILEIVDLIVQEELASHKRKPVFAENILRLLEGKIDDAILQYQGDEHAEEYLSVLKAENVMPKYVPWLVNKMKELTRTVGPLRWGSVARNNIVIVKRFDKMLTLNQLQPEHRDINQIKSIDIFGVLDQAEKTYHKKQAGKQAKKSTPKIYEDAEFLIVEPETEEASCQYGKGTKWCISATETENWFDDYRQKGARFLFVMNKKTNDKDAIAFAGDISQVEIYDSQDHGKTVDYIEEKYPTPVLEAINKFLDSIIGISPFSTVKLNDVIQNPTLMTKTPALIWKFVNGLNYEKLGKSMDFLEAVVDNPELFAAAAPQLDTAVGYLARQYTVSNQRSASDSPVRLFQIAQALIEKGISVTPVAMRLISVYAISHIHNDERWSHPSWLMPLAIDPRKMEAAFQKLGAGGFRLYDEYANDMYKLLTSSPLKANLLSGYQHAARDWSMVDDADVDANFSYVQMMKILNQKAMGFNWDIVAMADSMISKANGL